MFCLFLSIPVSLLLFWFFLYLPLQRCSAATAKPHALYNCLTALRTCMRLLQSISLLLPPKQPGTAGSAKLLAPWVLTFTDGTHRCLPHHTPPVESGLMRTLYSYCTTDRDKREYPRVKIWATDSLEWINNSLHCAKMGEFLLIYFCGRSTAI